MSERTLPRRQQWPIWIKTMLRRGLPAESLTPAFLGALGYQIAP